MSWRDAKDFALETSKTIRDLKGAVRRLVVQFTDGALWQMLAATNVAGDDDVVSVEVFQGIGIYARPPADGRADGIGVQVGGSKHLVAVGLRDQATLKAVEAALGREVAQGETLIFTPKICVFLTEDGHVEIGRPGEPVGPVTPLSEHNDLVAKFNDFVSKYNSHTNPSGGGIPPASAASSADPGVGTDVLRAE